MRVTLIEYPGDNSAVITIKCQCGARFKWKVGRQKFVECEACRRRGIPERLAEQYHIEQMLAEIGK